MNVHNNKRHWSPAISEACQLGIAWQKWNQKLSGTKSNPITSFLDAASVSTKTKRGLVFRSYRKSPYLRRVVLMVRVWVNSYRTLMNRSVWVQLGSGGGFLWFLPSSPRPRAKGSPPVCGVAEILWLPPSIERIPMNLAVDQVLDVSLINRGLLFPLGNYWNGIKDCQSYLFIRPIKHAFGV